MSDHAALTVDDYSVAYRTARGAMAVLDSVALTIDRGEVLGLVGESGSGKSSLAYAIMRALRAPVAHESGHIALGETTLTDLDERAMTAVRGRRIAMVFQDPGASLNPTLTIGVHFEQVLARHRALEGSEASGEIQRLLAMVHLPDPTLTAAKYPHELSGGEKQRATIALAFACDPELILFDEPTSALDATTAVNVLALFRELQQRTGVAALFISHDLGVVGEIAHRVAVIYAGRVVEVARTDDLFRTPRHPYTRALLASLPRAPADGETRALVTIPGSLPDRFGAEPGCAFAPRCAFATATCRSHAVAPVVEDGRAVACHHWRSVTGDLAGEEAVRESRAPRDGARLSVSGLSVRIRRPDFLGRLLGRPSRAVHAVEQVNLELRPGETLGLVGESGCGKSSLARALTGLRAFDGRIVLEGRETASVGDIDRAFRRQVQIVFQNPDLSLNPRHSVRTILSRPLRLYGGVAKSALDAEIGALLARVNLPEAYARRYPHELSGGEKQRIAIARALGARPAVIVCDEITSGLDASVQAAVVNLLARIQAEEDLSLLFITHDLNLLRHVADRVAVMYLGRIVEVRDAATLARPPYHPYTEALLSSAPTLDPALELRRVTLEGSIPTRLGELPGCPFASRCPRRAGPICDSDTPPVVSFPGGHTIACHLPPDTLRAVPPIWRAVDAPSGRNGHS